MRFNTRHVPVVLLPGAISVNVSMTDLYDASDLHIDRGEQRHCGFQFLMMLHLLEGTDTNAALQSTLRFASGS
jgi:hypothetical protein